MRGVTAAFAISIALVLGLPPAVARAMPRPSGRTARVEGGSRLGGSVPATGLSIGSPTDGHLVGGAHLDESPWLRVTPCYEGEDVRWGLEGLVSLVDHAARSVRKEFPDSVLSVGHLSRRTGGDVERHASHESGRDADVGFYITNQQGKPIYAEHFVRFLGDGTAPSWPGARFDDARNWAFVSSIVTSGRAHVSYLFVASPLRARLLAYAQKIGAPYATRVRASEVMAQPRGSLPHDDHFHVRISCPSFMEACVEFPTRKIARAKVPRVRSRGLSATMHASAGPNGDIDRSAAETLALPPPAHPVAKGAVKPIQEEEISGVSGSHPPAPLEGPVQIARDHSSPPTSSDPASAAAPTLEPPAAVEAPIDDVDGELE